MEKLTAKHKPWEFRVVLSSLGANQMHKPHTKLCLSHEYRISQCNRIKNNHYVFLFVALDNVKHDNTEVIGRAATINCKGKLPVLTAFRISII